MIYPIQMYACKCDGCGYAWEDGDYAMAYQEKENVQMSIDDSDWHTTEEGKTYCPECWSIDDNDNIVLKINNNANQGTDT